MRRSVNRAELVASACTCSGAVLELLPLLRPVLPALVLHGVAVKLVIDSVQPLHLQTVELADVDAADFRPRPIDEGVVVQELAAEHERDSEKTEQVGVGLGLSVQHGHPLVQVEHAEQDGGRGQPRRTQHLVNPLAE